MICPTCKRDCPKELTERHHLKTRKESKEIRRICRECHKAIHSLFNNKQLKKNPQLNTVEGLIEHETFTKQIEFISKLKVGKFMKTRESKQRKK